jgi:hypothetical protein
MPWGMVTYKDRIPVVDMRAKIHLTEVLWMDFLKLFRATAFLLLCALLLASCSLSMQQGKAWLDTKTDVPKLNVSGTWMCQEFSMAQLNQEGRDVTGAFYSGGLIKGVVSGNSISLLIYDTDTVIYMAELEAVDQKTIKGNYVRASGSMLKLKDWSDFARPMGLVKMPPQ